MPGAAAPAPEDATAALIAAYACGVSDRLEPSVERAVKCVLIDSIAVAMGALRHRAAQAARRYAYRFSGTEGGCVIWGSTRRAAPEVAALANGVLLRCHDYNDFFVGARSSAHPSDMVAGVIAAAEWVGAPGPVLIAAIAVGYEVTAAMLDAFDSARAGWDYTILTAVGAACAIARILRLDAAQLREALAITVIPHFASDEIESSELNRRGDLTMWKRFNGSDAVRHALQACLLAASGVEGAVRPFEGRLGFAQKLDGADGLGVLRDRLDPGRPLGRVADTYMKRWPVGSQAQSAIQAALAARAQVGDVTRIRQVRVFAEEGAYDHLVRFRQAPWEPNSRETADHSLPYIVAAAVLEGEVRSESFSPSRVLDPARRRFLKEAVVVTAAPELGRIADGTRQRAEAGYLSRVEIETQDGAVFHGEAAPFPGHPRNPFSDADLAAKLRDNSEFYAGAAGASRLLDLLLRIERVETVAALTAHLALGRAEIDEATVE
jgi:2-methylcitrate dehydratase